MAEIDSEDRSLYRLGAASAFAVAVGYVVITGLYVVAALVPQEPGRVWLEYLAPNIAIWWAIVALSIVTDLLYVPVAAALYGVLRPAGRNLALAGAVLLVLFVVLDLAVTWTNYAALIDLSSRYAASSDQALRDGYAAAATYGSAVLGSPAFSFYAILVPSLGILFLSWVMLRAGFGRPAAYVGLITGALGIAAVIGGFFIPALGTVAIVASVLTLIWFLLVGIRLTRATD